MMIDLTGSEKITYNTFVERAIADDRPPPSPRIRALDALVAELSRPHRRRRAVAGGRARRSAKAKAQAMTATP
jgi:hypothetical protein